MPDDKPKKNEISAGFPSTSSEAGQGGTKAGEQEMVSISKDKLTEILGRMERLEQAADKSRLQWVDAGKKQAFVPRVRLNVYEDLEKRARYVIVMWAKVLDEVFVTTQGVPYEKQIIKLWLADEEDPTKDEGIYKTKTIEVEYLTFIRRTQKADAEIVKRENDTESGITIFHCKRLSDGKLFKVDSRIVN